MQEATRLGMAVRDDQGGLGNLTYRAWQQLRPEVTLVVQSRPCRGTPNSEKFFADWTETFVVSPPIPDATWEEMAKRADVWWTAETWYSDNAETILSAQSARTVLYAMPELFNGSNADEVWNPTNYLETRSRLGTVMQWPTTPPKHWLPRNNVRNLLHISSGASLDRNGTQTFLEALKQVETPCSVYIHAPDEGLVGAKEIIGGLSERHDVAVGWDYEEDLERLYGWADMLVLPRRYAGLCLPAFEAFGTGCLVLMPDVEPQARWPIVPVPAIQRRPVPMKGGKIPMWKVAPLDVAAQIERLASSDESQIVRLSEEARRWAENNSWETALPVWEKALGR